MHIIDNFIPGSSFPMEQPSSVAYLGPNIDSYSIDMETPHSEVLNSPAWHIHLPHRDVGGLHGEGEEGHHGGGQEAREASSSSQENK